MSLGQEVKIMQLEPRYNLGWQNLLKLELDHDAGLNILWKNQQHRTN